MIYIDKENQNLHPDVREHLWMRSSGAAQVMKTYDGYVTGNDTKNYYSILEESPIPPNPSVGTIKADQTRISFDLEVTGKSQFVQKIGSNQLTQKMM